MSSNLNEMNYELVDERKILYDFDEINKLEVSQNEDLNHFNAKAILTYILNEINHDVICDYYIAGVGIVDLYDISTRMIYDFQYNNSTNKELMENDILIQNIVEVIIINIDELPDNIFQRYLKLKEYIFSD